MTPIQVGLFPLVTFDLIDAANLKAWRNAIAEAAARAIGEAALLKGPLGLIVTFTLPRPKSHFGRAGNVLPSAPPYTAGHPDLDKLARALQDALKGVVWTDDSQVVTLAARKVYGPAPGARVGVTHPTDQLLAFDWNA